MKFNAEFKIVQANFNSLERIIERDTIYKADDKCVVDLRYDEEKENSYLAVKWGQVKILGLNRDAYRQLMYIFYNKNTKSFIIDTSDVKFKNDVDVEKFKDDFKLEIQNLLSKNDEKEI